MLDLHRSPPHWTEDDDCPCREGMFATRGSNRRRFLFAAGSGAALALSPSRALAEGKAPAGAQLFDVPEDPTKE